MTETKKPLPVCETESGEEIQIALAGVRLSNGYSITDFEPKQGSVAAFLLYGRENALTAHELERITGMTNREITRTICAERRDGAPILSDTGAGFWLAESSEELLHCAAALHHRAGEIHRTAKALEKLAGGGDTLEI